MSIKRSIFLAVQLLLLFSCKGQNPSKKILNTNIATTNTLQVKKEEDIGIVYFSTDNGNTWKNASNGLPQNLRIGLGGIASSSKLLALATKEYGVFVYNLKDSIWNNIATRRDIIEANIGALIYYNNTFYVGTQTKGIFISNNNGKNWQTLNAGLGDLTIRRFISFNNELYVCTNDGFYLLDKRTNNWILEYGENEESSLQVNGATIFKNSFFIATNKGIYSRDKQGNWKNVLPNNSVHNISSDDEYLYGMTYTSLLLSSKNGTQWQSIQNGLPQKLYTFNVLNVNGTAFAGQWDGVYKKKLNSAKWELSSKGLPTNFAITNFKVFNNILVVSTSERKLKNVSN